MNILFKGKYARTPLDTKSAQNVYARNTVLQVDQAALKFKERIQLALPPEVEIRFQPGSSLEYLNVFRNGEPLIIGVNSYSHWTNSEARSSRTIEKWMARTIDKAKAGYELYLLKHPPKNPLEEVNFQRVELVTQVDRKRLSGQITPWARVSESLANELGTIGAEKVIEVLNSKAAEFENALGSDFILEVVSLLKTPGITVIVKKKNLDGTSLPYKPLSNYDDSVISQIRVPKLPRPLSWIPLRKPEKPVDFFNRVLSHIKHLKKQEEELKFYQAFIALCKSAGFDNFEVNANDYLHAYGWEALKPTLTNLKEYSGFIKKLDPKVYLTYTGSRHNEIISIAYKDQGNVGSILGEMANVGNDCFKVVRSKKQTPELFLKSVFDKVKELLLERQRLENLLKASKPEEAFSF